MTRQLNGTQESARSIQPRMRGSVRATNRETSVKTSPERGANLFHRLAQQVHGRREEIYGWNSGWHQRPGPGPRSQFQYKPNICDETILNL